MSHFRRVYVPGGCFFFTVVTERRTPVLLAGERQEMFPRTGSRTAYRLWCVSSLKVLALTIRDRKGVKKLPAPEQVFVDLGQLRFGANVIPVGFNNGF